jgi:ketosteroid isomerase-like protein
MSRKQETIMERSSELAAVLQSVYTAVSEGDADTLTAMLSARDGLVFIGTDPDEWFDDTATIKAMLTAQAGAGVKVRPGAITAFEEGTVGWVASHGAFVTSDDSEVPFRLTAVFHRENGTWRLVQEHASIAVTNSDALGVTLDG